MLNAQEIDITNVNVEPSEPDGEAAMPHLSQTKKASSLNFAQQVVDPAFSIAKSAGFTQATFTGNRTFATLKNNDPLLCSYIEAVLQKEHLELRNKLLHDKNLTKQEIV